MKNINHKVVWETQKKTKPDITISSIILHFIYNRLEWPDSAITTLKTNLSVKLSLLEYCKKND